MSHAGRTGVDNMIRVLSIVVPLKADAPPSAVALLRDPVAELTERPAPFWKLRQLLWKDFLGIKKCLAAAAAAL